MFLEGSVVSPTGGTGVLGSLSAANRHPGETMKFGVAAV
jgi:hypothetical protein